MSRHTTISEDGMRVILEGLLNGKTNTELAVKLKRNIASIRQASCMFNIYAGGGKVELEEQCKAFLKALSVPSPEIVRQTLYGWKRVSGTATPEELRDAMHTAPKAELNELLSNIKSPVAPTQKSDAKEQGQEVYQPDKETGRVYQEAFGTEKAKRYEADPPAEPEKKDLPVQAPEDPDWKKALRKCLEEVICCLQNLAQKL
jgi:hypothetical protein